MIDIPAILAGELALARWQVENALALFAEGATVPFVARYRKERTGEMTDVALRALAERHQYLVELEERKEAIISSIDAQGRLTPELRTAIDACLQKTELEDLYLPYRPKKRTRATIAREQGLEPLADRLRALNAPDSPSVDLHGEAASFVDSERGVPDTTAALRGASDILAEEVAEQAELRAHIRTELLERGVFVSRISEAHPAGSTRFEMYRDYRAPVRDIAPHNMLALRRGEAEGVLTFDLVFDEESTLAWLEAQRIHTSHAELRAFLREMVRDAFSRLMKHALIGEARLTKKQEADLASIRTFEENVRELLLASPAGLVPTLGVDPGFRTGCKVVAIGTTGAFLEYAAVFPHQGDARRADAAETVRRMVRTHAVELVAVGNGTAGRETEAFIREALAGLESAPVVVMVSEAGASVYSASETAHEEFPDLDVTVRGAISIGRRLQDPLAELVKIDPKSIGVGQYQHDVDQRLLKRRLDETVESCVNHVGVDVNSASKELLGYVAGLTPAVAKSVVTYRDQRGPFRSRRELLDVPRFGPKAFEQAAGFLRIRGGEHPLDATAVHPESYHIVERIARDIDMPLDRIGRMGERLRSIDIRRYVTDTVGEPTLRDILSELEKPGRDPRAEFRYARFADRITAIEDLSPGMELEGVVTNVANFGAFVDIGVHQDGLVHISQLADRYVADPRTVVKVGQIVRVRVIDVQPAQKRIALSMRSGPSAPKNGGIRAPAGSPGGGRESGAPSGKRGEQNRKHDAPPTLDDLKAKFNKRS